MSAILHVSDIHFGCQNKAAVQAVGEIARAGGYALIVVSGDITQFGRPREFADAAAWIAELGGPIMLTPGNHDTPYAGLIERAVSPFSRYERHFGSPWSSAFEGEDLAARAFNTARGMQWRANWSKGAVDIEHVEHAVSDLRLCRPSSLRLAVCHHPLIEVVGGPVTGKVHGGRQACDLLANSGVDLVLSGHVHTAFALSLPCGDGLTHTVGAATLSLRERGQPAGYNEITWDQETITVKSLGWTGSHFEPIRTWALPRRRR